MGAPIGLFVRSYAIQTSISEHVFDYVAIPEYSVKDPLHIKVVELAKKCHAVSATGQAGELENSAKKLDEAATEVLEAPTERLPVMRNELQVRRGTVPSLSERDE